MTPRSIACRAVVLAAALAVAALLAAKLMSLLLAVVVRRLSRCLSGRRCRTRRTRSKDGVAVALVHRRRGCAVLAMARLGEARYYAPGYVLAIPAALWLLRRQRSHATPVLVWALVAVVLVPTFLHMRNDAHIARAAEVQSTATTQLADRLLKPNQFAIVTGYDYPVADARWWSLVANYIYSAPNYPYRFVPDVPNAIQMATAEGEHAATTSAPSRLASPIASS